MRTIYDLAVRLAETAEEQAARIRPSDPYNAALTALISAAIYLAYRTHQTAGPERFLEEARAMSRAVLGAAQHILARRAPRRESH